MFAVSNALQLGLSISEGVVSGIRDFGGDTYIQFTAAIAPGSEGGGLFDVDGRLLGFITYRARDGQNVNFAIPIRRLAEIEKRLGAASAADGLSASAAGLMQQGKWADLAQHAKIGWRQMLTVAQLGHGSVLRRNRWVIGPKRSGLIVKF